MALLRLLDLAGGVLRRSGRGGPLAGRSGAAAAAPEYAPQEEHPVLSFVGTCELDKMEIHLDTHQSLFKVCAVMAQLADWR